MARLWRAGLLALTVVPIAWFAISARQAVNTSRATAVLGTGKRVTPAQAQHARSLLDAAGFLNPDLSVELLRGQLASAQGHRRAAERIFASVTRREPQNLAAWSELAFAAAAVNNRPELVVAARHISELYPKLR